MRCCHAGVAPNSEKMLFANATNAPTIGTEANVAVLAAPLPSVFIVIQIDGKLTNALLVVDIAVILGTPMGFRNTPGNAFDTINDGMNKNCHRRPA